jgi:signal transduction histidine kinase
MKERTTELNGELEIQSLPDGGTWVQASFPLEVYSE